jgi:RNA polymerase sigma-70 factor (sigma-E family)
MHPSNDTAAGGFEQFAREVAAPLYRTAWLLTADAHLAEDLVQECLARLYRAWPVHADHPVAYARRTLVRIFLSHRRKRANSERPAADLPERAVHDSDAALRRTLVDALLTLSERDRAVVVLRYLADRSVEEVARDLGRSPGAIRVQAMRALAKLRDVLGESALDLVNP